MKKLAILLFALLISLNTIGCGGGGKQADATAEKPAVEEQAAPAEETPAGEPAAEAQEGEEKAEEAEKAEGEEKAAEKPVSEEGK